MMTCVTSNLKWPKQILRRVFWYNSTLNETSKLDGALKEVLTWCKSEGVKNNPGETKIILQTTKRFN